MNPDRTFQNAVLRTDSDAGDETPRWALVRPEHLLARANADGMVPIARDIAGRDLPTLPLLGPDVTVAFGRRANPGRIGGARSDPMTGALDQPFMAGEVPNIFLLVPSADAVYGSVDDELAGIDGIRVAKLPPAEGETWFAFVAFRNGHADVVLATWSTCDADWPRLHQIDVLAQLAGCVALHICVLPEVGGTHRALTDDAWLFRRRVPMLPTQTEVTIERIDGWGVGFRVASAPTPEPA